MPYTIYDVQTHKVLARLSQFPRDGLPEGQDWVLGDFDDSRYRIDAETGAAYPFIEQEQLQYLIRQKSKRMMDEAGAADADIARWSAAKAAHEMLGGANIDGKAYSDDAFRDLLTERKRIIDRAAELTEMSPIPQDVEDDRWW